MHVSAARAREDGRAVNHETMTMDDIEANIVRCPDEACAQKMIDAIDEVRVKGDSRRRRRRASWRSPPRGEGAPAFDKLEADLAKAMLSLPATKGSRSAAASTARCKRVASTTMSFTWIAIKVCERAQTDLGVFKEVSPTVR